MDRAVVTGMVEDYWRSRTIATQIGGMAASMEVAERFELRIAETAKLLPPLESAAFLQTVDAERDGIMAEYQADPIAFKRRLGIPLGIDEVPAQAPSRASSGLGDLAVRTVVRATIWESIWAIFRVAL